MLRITETSVNGKTISLRLDGTLNASSWPDLEEVCVRHRTNDGKILLLDLAGIVFMDDCGAESLARLRGEFVEIINCSPFIETLLKTVGK
jgi:anti-anti-sigma regulatory factor